MNLGCMNLFRIHDRNVYVSIKYLSNKGDFFMLNYIQNEQNVELI